MTTAIDFRVSQRELSLILGVAPATILAWVRKGYIPKPQRVSRNTLYSLCKVRDAIEANCLKINPPIPLDQI